jgi:hypothetical protein
MKTKLFYSAKVFLLALLPLTFYLLLFTFYLSPVNCSAQNVGINNTGTLPNASAKSATYSGEVPFTLEDRDRIIQMQIKMDERFESINTRFESQQKQINFQIELFYWGFGIMIALMIFLLGFIIWDRRTAMEPIRKHTQSLIFTLREYAKEQPKLAEILRSYGLM